MDLGCYCMHWIRTVAADEPTVVSARARCVTPGVDLDIEAELAFTSGPTATLRCSMQPENGELYRRLLVQGDKGVLELDNPVSPHSGATLSIESDSPSLPQIVSGGDTTFHYQLRHVLDVHRGPRAAADGRRRRDRQHARHRRYLPRRGPAAARPSRLSMRWTPRHRLRKSSSSRSTRAPPARAR